MVPEAGASCSLQMRSWLLKMSFPLPDCRPVAECYNRKDAHQSTRALRGQARRTAFQLLPSVTFSCGRAAERQQGATCAAPPRRLAAGRPAVLFLKAMNLCCAAKLLRNGQLGSQGNGGGGGGKHACLGLSLSHLALRAPCPLNNGLSCFRLTCLLF